MSPPGPTAFALQEGLRAEGKSMTVIASGVTDLNAEIDRLSTLGISTAGPINETGLKTIRILF